MATLTSTITITGTINGQKVNIASTVTLDNIYDAGIAQPTSSEDTFSSASFDALTGAMVFEQNCPSYLMAVNRSVSEAAAVSLSNTAQSTDRYMVLPPGAFVVLSEYQNGAGIVTINASSSTTTLEGVSLVSEKVLDDIGYLVRMDFMAAFQAAS